MTKEDCERDGKIFVPSHTTKEGSYIHAYSKEGKEEAKRREEKQ